MQITQLATRGVFAGTPITAPSTASPLTIDASNDGLQVRVDGVNSGAISLTQGSFDSGEALAAAIQSRINGDDVLDAAAARVEVSFTGDDRLQIRSARFGSDSDVEITAIQRPPARSGWMSAAGRRGWMSPVRSGVSRQAATGRGSVVPPAARWRACSCR